MRKDDEHNVEEFSLGATERRIAWTGARMTCTNRVFLSSGISQWPRQVPSGPPAPPPVWGARRSELAQPAGATVGLHEHSEVHAATDGQFLK